MRAQSRFTKDRPTDGEQHRNTSNHAERQEEVEAQPRRQPEEDEAGGRVNHPADHHRHHRR